MLTMTTRTLSIRRAGAILTLLPLLSGVTLLGATRAQAQKGATSPWVLAQPMSIGRYAPGVVRLPDTAAVPGPVLVAGGHNSPGETASAQLFDHSTQTWTTTGSLLQARNFPAAVLVDEDGDLKGETPVFFGGYNSVNSTNHITYKTAERYNIKDGVFEPISQTMNIPRELFTATVLPDGKVLLAGGFNTGYGGGTLSSTDIYDPVTRTFAVPTAVGTMTARAGRFGHDAIVLPGDKYVLIVGGKERYVNRWSVSWSSLNSVEIYDIAARKFYSVPYTMKYRRDRVTAALVNGKVLLVGGTAELPGTTRFDPLPTEWFDPSAITVGRKGIVSVSRNPFSEGPSLSQGRMAHSLTMLPDGGFLVVGGWSEKRDDGTRGTTASAERFFPDATHPLGGIFKTVDSPIYDSHDHGAALLPDGRVLIVGGKKVTDGVNATYPNRAEVYTP